MSRRRARGRKTPGAAGHRPSQSPFRARALVVADPVVHHLVQVPAHELLVAQREGRDGTRFQPHLRGLEGSTVLQGVLLDGGDAQLLSQVFAHAAWRREIGVRLEEEPIMCRGPVVVGEIPTRLPEHDREVREDLEGIQAPALLVARVEARRQLVGHDLRHVPGPEQAAAHHALDGVVELRHQLPAGAPARRTHAMRAVGLEVHGVEPLRLIVRSPHDRVLVTVEDGRVVELLEGVEEDLPVAADVTPVIVALRQLLEGVVDRGDHRAEKLRESLLRLLGEVHEDEPLPHVAVHRHEAVVRLVDPEELALLEDVRQATVELVPPAVVLACELPARTADLLGRVVGPHQLVAAVAADVVEGADLVIHATDDDQRGIRDRELLGEEAPLSPELLDPPDVQPGAFEDGFALELVELGRDRAFVRYRRGSQVGIVLRPGALGRFRVLLRGSLRRFLHAARASVSVHMTMPPFTPITWPVMKPASSEQRNPHVAATSSGVPVRPTGIIRAASFSILPMLPLASARRSIGVSIMPGGMQFTVMPWGASSSASAPVSPITPAFDATSCAMCGEPDCALDDEIVTIRPQRAATMSATAACRQWNVPVKLMARVRSQVSAVMLVKGSKDSRPAAVTMMVMGPSCARTSARAAS